MTSALSSAFSGSSALPSQPASALAPLPQASTSSVNFSDDADARAAEVAKTLHKLEELLDDAYSMAGSLAVHLVAARRAHRRSAIIGQRVFVELGAVQVAISTARGHTVGAHRMLDSVAQAIGVNTASFGDGGKGPDSSFGLFARDEQPVVA